MIHRRSDGNKRGSTSTLRRFRRLSLAALGAGAIMMPACSIPTHDAASGLNDVPAELLASTTTSAPLPEEGPEFELVLYWHGEQGRLIRVRRPVSTQPTVAEAITRLLEGPTQDEISRNPAEYFQPDAGLTDAALNPQVSEPVDGILTITFASQGKFRELDNKRNAAAELVCTVTEFEGISGVIVRDDLPDPIVLPGTNSELIEGPAMRSHYADCVGVDALTASDVSTTDPDDTPANRPGAAATP